MNHFVKLTYQRNKIQTSNPEAVRLAVLPDKNHFEMTYAKCEITNKRKKIATLQTTMIDAEGNGRYRGWDQGVDGDENIDLFLDPRI